MNTPWLARAAVGVLVVSVFAVLLALAGTGGAFYAVLLVAAMLPGLPLGVALFGRRHPAGWIAGLLFGYALTSLAWWAVVYARVPSTAAFVAAWFVAGVLAWLKGRFLGESAVVLPAWSRNATTGLALVLLLVPAIVGRPFVKLGSIDGEGRQLYRAYFIADFVWHTALTAELSKETQPPRNPYLVSQPVHYYWTYFRVPATLARHAGFDVQTALKLNAMAAALLMVSAIYLVAWTALPAWPLAVSGAVAITILAPSIEGFAATLDLLRRGQPLSGLKDLNIDAIAAWAFKGLRIDDLPRAMWYTPQHSTAYALGLLAIPVALVAGVRARPAAIALAGLALGASLAFNPLVGAFFCAVYGATVFLDAVRSRARIGQLLMHGLAVLPVLLAFGWCTLNQVGDGAAAALHFGFWGPATHSTAIVFLLSFGGLLAPMAAGMWPDRRAALTTIWPAIIGVTIAVLLMHLVTLTVDQAWVGFRGGHLFFVMAPAIVARGFIVLWQRRLHVLAIAMAVGVLAAGLPTTLIDAYNTQDVTNFRIAPGDFHWTVSVTGPEREALGWIRTHTPPNAVVQAEPIVRGRETWSLIPSWAERRMATGNALPLLPVPDYDVKNAQVRDIYASDDAKAAWWAAKALRIDYLYADAKERGQYPGAAKFDAHPEYFEPVFRNAEAGVYAVRP